MWKILGDRNATPPYLSLEKSVCRSGSIHVLYSGHGTIDWFQIGKGIHQGSILSPCLFNLQAEYSMINAGLEEVQAGIKTLPILLFRVPEKQYIREELADSPLCCTSGRHFVDKEKLKMKFRYQRLKICHM